MNSLSIVFCVLAVSVLTSDAFKFLGGFDGEKKPNKRHHPDNFFGDLGRDASNIWTSLFSPKHRKPRYENHNDDHDDDKRKSSWRGTIPKSSRSGNMEAILTKSMYAQFKAYEMMTNAYKLLGESVKLQREALVGGSG